MKGRLNYLAWSGTGLMLMFTVIFSLTSLHYLRQFEQTQLSAFSASEQLQQPAPIQNLGIEDSVTSRSIEVTAGFKKLIAFQVCIGVVASLLVYLLIAKFITQPLKISKAAVDILASGDVGFQLKINPPSEIGELSTAIRQANISIHKFENELKNFAIALQKKQFHYRINQNEYSGFYRNILKRLNQGMQAVETLSSLPPEIHSSTRAENNSLKELVDSLQEVNNKDNKSVGLEPDIDELALQSILNTLQGLMDETRPQNKPGHPEKKQKLEKTHSNRAE